MKSEGKKDIILKCGPWRKRSEEEEEEEKTPQRKHAEVPTALEREEQ